MKGRRDDVPMLEEGSIKRGNFKHLIWLISEFDKTLKDNIESCAQNPTFLPKTIQYDFWNICRRSY